MRTSTVHVLVVYSYFVLEKFEECSTEGDVRDDARAGGVLTRRESAMRSLCLVRWKRLIRVGRARLHRICQGDYRAMICHLFLNKKEIPSIQKIISQLRGALGEGEENFNKEGMQWVKLKHASSSSLNA